MVQATIEPFDRAEKHTFAARLQQLVEPVIDRFHRGAAAVFGQLDIRVDGPTCQVAVELDEIAGVKSPGDPPAAHKGLSGGDVDHPAHLLPIIRTQASRFRPAPE